MLQTKRSKQINDCLQVIMQRVATWVPSPSLVTTAKMLKENLEIYGIDVDFTYACNKVMHYRRKHQRITNKAQKGILHAH